MAMSLTKTDIEFNEFRVWRATTQEVVDEEIQEITRWYISVGYKVTTQEGETWTRDVTREVTGALKTRASGLLQAIRDYILQQEGLT